MLTLVLPMALLAGKGGALFSVVRVRRTVLRYNEPADTARVLRLLIPLVLECKRRKIKCDR